MKNWFNSLIMALCLLGVGMAIGACSEVQEEKNVGVLIGHSEQSLSGGFTLICDTILMDSVKFEASFEGGVFPFDMSLFCACRYRGQYVLRFDEALLSLSDDMQQIKYLSTYNLDLDYWYGEFFVRNDSLLLEDRMEDSVYFSCYDPKMDKWNVCYREERTYCMFRENCEDEDFVISFANMGEFGNYLLFRDKQTGVEYLHHGCMHRLLRYNNAYYVVCNTSIFTIEDPRDAIVYQGELSRKAEARATFHKPLISSVPDWVTNAENPGIDTTFHSAILIEDSLFVVASNKTETVVSLLEGDSIRKVCAIQPRSSILDDRVNRLGVNAADDCAIMTFFDYERGTCGVIDVQGRNIHVITLMAR